MCVGGGGGGGGGRGLFYVVVSLCKGADSQDPSLLAQNGIQSPFESPHENFEL